MEERTETHSSILAWRIPQTGAWQATVHGIVISSRNTYHLTWVSLTLDKGYLLTATPPDLERGVAPLSPPPPM